MKKYLYFNSEQGAQSAIKAINAAQAQNKTFYNVSIRVTKNGKTAVVIG
jgi:hypothetical protein